MNTQIVSFKDLKTLIGNKSRTTIWRWEKQNLFPKRMQFGPNSVGWMLADIEDWVQQKTMPSLPSTKTNTKRNLTR